MGYLAFSRRENESIMIGDVEVTVTKIGGKRVGFVVNAPREIDVHRKEVWLKIRARAQQGGEASGSQELEPLPKLYDPDAAPEVVGAERSMG